LAAEDAESTEDGGEINWKKSIKRLNGRVIWVKMFSLLRYLLTAESAELAEIFS